jgi:O-antigen/teichoic acid export membrane protein
MVAVLNYAFHPVMSRMMSVEDFGEVQALISMTYLVSILGIIFGTIAVNIVSNRDASSTSHVKLLSQLHKLALYTIGAFAVGIIALSPYLKQVLQFESAWSFLPLAMGTLIGIPFIFYGSYLKGQKEFGIMSFTGIIASAGKILFAVILVMLGLRVFGAVSAFALATFTALLYTLHKTKGEFRLNWREKFVYSPEIKKELSYGVLIFFSLGYVTFLYTSDVLFVKHFFPPETAGLYSGIATIARIIFFATASVAGVLLPTIKMKASYEENSVVMKKATIIIALMGVGALSIFYLFPEFIIAILIGDKYIALAELLPLAGLYIFLASVVNLFYSYFLALRDRRLIVISSLGAVLTVGLLIFQHDTLKMVVVNYVIGTIVTLGLIGISIIKSKSP